MDRISQIQSRIEQIESFFKPPEKQQEGQVSFQQMLNQAQSNMRIDNGAVQQNFGQVMAPGMAFMPTVSPTGGGSTSGFVNPCPGGKLSPYKGDDGLDIHAPRGTQVLAAKDGVVVYNDPSGHSAWEGTGNDTGAIRIRHSDGTETWYAHLSGRNENLKPGMFVKAGTPIGQVGTANNVPHLHMSVFYSSGGDDGGFMDPFELAKAVEQGGGNTLASQPPMPNMYGMNPMMNQFGTNPMMNQYGMNQTAGYNQVGGFSGANMNNVFNMQMDQGMMAMDQDEGSAGF